MIKRSFTSIARKSLLRRGRALLRHSERNGGSASDFLAGLNMAERDELAEIHKALERIERGIFGQCMGCSTAIDEERLQARPWERHCAACDSEEAAEVVPSAGDSVELRH